MPFVMETNGIDELLRKLEKTEGAARGIAAQALYEGAGVVADEISKKAAGLKTKRVKFPMRDGQRMPSPEEKAIVTGQGAAGIAKFKFNGTTVDTSIGYSRSGYATAPWNGKQVPIAKIANAINHGTSFMKKQPFIRQAVSQSAGRAQEAIEEKIRELVDKEMSD